MYIECNLSTDYSYKQKLTEMVSGEMESQEVPVTPYTIEIEISPNLTETYYYRVFVDGIKVKGLSLEGGDKRCIKGFRDGAVIRELLFSMPRFASDDTDRLSCDRLNRVGQIEVECWNAELKTSEWKVRKKNLNFTQANKKDAYTVTQGQFTMATSKAGRAVCSRREFRCVDHWKRMFLVSRLIVFYRMSRELEEIGIKLIPFCVDNKSKKSLKKNRDKKRKRKEMRNDEEHNLNEMRIIEDKSYFSQTKKEVNVMNDSGFESMTIKSENKHQIKIRRHSTDICIDLTNDDDDDECEVVG